MAPLTAFPSPVRRSPRPFGGIKVLRGDHRFLPVTVWDNAAVVGFLFGEVVI